MGIYSKKSKYFKPAEIEEIVKLLTLQPNNEPELLGSMSLKSIQYAVDYDFFNMITLKNITDYKSYITRLISNLETIINKNTLITDIKYGVNKNIYKSDFKNYKEVFYYIESNKYISTSQKKELNKLYNNINNENDIINQFYFLDAFRKTYTLRWSLKELVNGYKMVDNEKKTLGDCLYDPAIFKIDLLAQTRKGLEEISIIYQFKYRNKILNGGYVDIKQSLRKDITILFGKEKYFKCLKRIFSYNTMKGDNERMNDNLIKLFNSNVGILYMVINDMEQIIEHAKEIKRENLLFEIDIIKLNLNKIYEFDNDLLDKITEKLFLLKSKDNEKIKIEVEEIKNIFEEILKVKTLQYIKNNDLIKYIESLFIKASDLIKLI